MQANQLSLGNPGIAAENRNDHEWQAGLRYAATALESQNIVVPHDPNELQRALERMIQDLEDGHRVSRSEYERLSVTIELMGWGLHYAEKDRVAQQLYDRFKALLHQIMEKRLLTDRSLARHFSAHA